MTEIAVFDRDGQPQTLAWALAKYGPFVIYPAPPPPNGDPPQAWKLVALREKNDATFIARMTDADGNPVPGVRSCFYWPDAPDLIGAGPLGAPFDGITPNRAVSGYANGNGESGYPMGPGGHYNAAAGEHGPHAAWIHGPETRSDVFLGVGMIRQDHLHLDAEWRLLKDEGEQPGPKTELAALVARIADAIEAIADILEASANG
jgi:hypothetical protein